MTTMEKRVMEARDDWQRSALLSDRQREILKRRTMGENFKGIAESMGISPKTVEFHWQGVKMRTRMSDLSDLTRFSIRVGLITAGLMLIVGCSDTPPIPHAYSNIGTSRGAERMIRRNVKPKVRANAFGAVPSMLSAPTWSSNMPPEWRFKSGIGHLVTIERNYPDTNISIVVSGYEPGSRPTTSNYSAYLYAGTNPPIFIAPETRAALIQILYSSAVDGPWYPLGDPIPSILPPPAFYKLSISPP